MKNTSKIIDYLGGRTTLYIFVFFLLIGLNVFLFNHISFVFQPIIALIQTTALPIVFSLAAYYLLRPIVKFAVTLGIKKVWAILVLLLFFSVAIIFIFIAIIPFFIDQAISLFESFPTYWSEFNRAFESWIQRSYFAPYYKDFTDFVNEFFVSTGDNATMLLSNTVESVLHLVKSITNFALALIVVPFILFYLLLEGEKLPKLIFTIVPPKIRPSIKNIFIQIDQQLKGYIQGQILVSWCIGIMMYIGFLIIGIDYPLILALLACVTSIVPYLGPTIAITPAIIIAIVTSPFMVLKLAIVWTIVQLIEGKLISPQIMGKSLKIHPITIIFILLTAAKLFGVIGVIIGIPAYAIIRTIFGQIIYLLKARYNRYVKEEDKYD